MPSEDMVSLVRYMEEQESFPCIFVHENAFYINYTNERTNEVFRLLNFPQPPSLPYGRLPKERFSSWWHFSRKNRRMRLWLPCLIVRQPGGIHCFRILFRKEVVSKWGRDKMLDYFGISLEESMAFGDGGNDVLMLKHVGIGVAMGNAEDEVKSGSGLCYRFRG